MLSHVMRMASPAARMGPAMLLLSAHFSNAAAIVVSTKSCIPKHGWLIPWIEEPSALAWQWICDRPVPSEHHGLHGILIRRTPRGLVQATVFWSDHSQHPMSVDMLVEWLMLQIVPCPDLRPLVKPILSCKGGEVDAWLMVCLRLHEKCHVCNRWPSNAGCCRRLQGTCLPCK
jgi:hypothetical protein